MKYVHYALFNDMAEAQGALRDLQTSGVLNDQVVLALHQDKVGGEDMRANESDGMRGLQLGLLCGALGGLVLGLVLRAVGILPFSTIHAAFLGLFLGSLVGAFGAGLYGAGLPAVPLHRLRQLWREGNVLVTAEAEGAITMAKVDRVFRRHHAIVATA
jgi:hypothetical protein